MLTALKIIGILGLLGLVVLFLAVRWVVRLVKGLVAANRTVPCRIHPEPEPNPQWNNGSVIRKIADDFRAAGFAEIGAFNIPEMAGLQFLAFLHPGEQFYGCVYDHPKMAPTFDVVCRRTDDTSVTGTNTRMGEALDQPPGRTTIRLEQAGVAEVVAAVRGHPAAVGPRQPVSAGAFLAFFAKAHADYMNWRLAKGGASREEIRRQATQDGQQITDEQVEETYQSMRETYVEQLRDGCLAQYLDDAGMSAAQWEPREGSVFAIPETLELKEVIETLECALSLDEEQRHQLSRLEAGFGRTGLDVIEDIFQRDVGALGLKKIGEVQTPVRAWILEIPSSIQNDGGPIERAA